MSPRTLRISGGLFSLSLLILVGCTTRIVLKNPRTDQTRDCYASGWDYMLPGRAADLCAKALEKDGWIRLGQD